MDDKRPKRGGAQRHRFRTVLLIAGAPALAAGVWFVHQRQMTRIDGAHLLYLPVVLACLWFGWRGLAVPVLGGVCLILTHFTGITAGNPLEHDILRAVVLVVVGAIVATLRQRYTAAQQEVRSLQRQLEKRRQSSEAEHEILSCRMNRQLQDVRAISEAALKGDAEKEKILDSLSEHVIYQDTEMRVLWANQAACDWANLPRETVIGRHCYELWGET